MKNIILFATLICWVSSSFAQNYLDALRPFQGMAGRSSFESGVVPGAFGSSNALTGNPAVLSYVEKGSFSLEMSMDQVQGRSVFENTFYDEMSDTGLRLNSLSYIRPVRVYRGAWVWGVNIHPISSFSSISTFSDEDPSGDFTYRHTRRESGSLYAYTIGTSFLATMNTSIGFAFSILNGHNEASKVYAEYDPEDIWTFDEFLDSLHFEPEYWGVGARLGFNTQLNDVLHVGGSLELPSRLWVTENASYLSIDYNDDGTSTVYEDAQRDALDYQLWGPWRIGVGLGLVNRPISASINYRLHTYPSIGFGGDIVDPDTGDDVDASIDEEIEDNLEMVHEMSASLEWDMRPLTLSFAGSFMNDALKYNLDPVLRLDMGVGYELYTGLGLTFAYRFKRWQGELDHLTDAGSTRVVDIENTLSMLQLGFKFNF